MKTLKTAKCFIFFAAIACILAGACNDDELNDPSLTGVDDTLALTLSDSVVEMDEKGMEARLDFFWSPGTNYSTGKAIYYTLEVDKKGSDFAEPLFTFVDDKKNIRNFSIDHGTLNRRMQQKGMEARTGYDLEARVSAQVQDTLSRPEQQARVSFTITTFKPVSGRLFILGDATPTGWDIENASEMQASASRRGVFTYEGHLGTGNFKFAVNRDACFCQDFYTRHPEDELKMVYNESGSGEDLQWTIAEEGLYKITADLLNLTVSIEPRESPDFFALWMVGDATRSGWDIDSPVEMEQDGDNPFVFTYEGNLSPGNFKIFAGPLGDWCGEWFRPSEDGQGLINEEVLQYLGCEPDNKWLVTEADQGRYRIILNTAENTIRFEKINLYIIGDGGPNDWNIATPEPMDYDNGDFVYTGPLGSINPTGEFKISKFAGDWCDGDWINAATAAQSISDPGFIHTSGCDGPDNKWKLKEGEAGSYEIRINLDTGTMTIAPI